MAGLAAGWKLHSTGYPVIVLEAQMHRGGRVHTIRQGLSDDLYAEAGAGRIPSTHTVTLEWIKHFGLELEPFYPSSLAQIALLQGKRVKLSMDGSVDMSLVPLDLTPQERRIGLRNLEEHYFGAATKLTGDRIREDWTPEAARLEEITASDFLRQKGASEDAIRYLLLGFEDAAAADFIKDVLNHNAAPLMRINWASVSSCLRFAAARSLALSGLVSGTAKMRSSHSISAMMYSASIRLHHLV